MLDLAPSIAELLPTSSHRKMLADGIDRAIRGATRGAPLSRRASVDLTRRCLKHFGELAGRTIAGRPVTFQRALDEMAVALRLDLAGLHYEPSAGRTWGRETPTQREMLDLDTNEARVLPTYALHR